MQNRKQAFFETIVQTVVGLLVSFIIQIIIYPLLNIPVTLGQNVLITFVFFVVSILRGYLIRRWFNKKQIKKQIWVN